jgi:hypothetical protein
MVAARCDPRPGNRSMSLTRQRAMLQNNIRRVRADGAALADARRPRPIV